MLYYFDFNGILTIVTMVVASLLLLDRAFFKSHRVVGEPEHKVFEYSKAFFPVLMLVLGLRVFIAEPYRIPSGSMKPTLLEGEFILVNKFTYGIRLPVIGKKIASVGSPQRGDITVFRSPKNPTQITFIKRIVGLPGDRISYQDKTLYINDEPQEQTFEEKDFDMELNGYVWRVNRSKEQLGSRAHDIFVRSSTGFDRNEVTVPEGHYFAMGDNRDNSEDSRSWGFVNDDYLLGKAFVIWMSWDAMNKAIRWHRIGMNISTI